MFLGKRLAFKVSLPPDQVLDVIKANIKVTFWDRWGLGWEQTFYGSINPPSFKVYYQSFYTNSVGAVFYGKITLKEGYTEISGRFFLGWFASILLIIWFGLVLHAVIKAMPIFLFGLLAFGIMLVVSNREAKKIEVFLEGLFSAYKID